MKNLKKITKTLIINFFINPTIFESLIKYFHNDIANYSESDFKIESYLSFIQDSLQEKQDNNELTLEEANLLLWINNFVFAIKLETEF